jgi:tetratricopeptide (TPR) repeat protein
LNINPNNIYALNGKGNALYGLGKYQDAITYYDRALAIDPNFVTASSNKQLALDMLERQAQQQTTGNMTTGG